jgi:hypothetical protein
MPLIPLQIPPGVFRNGTEFEQSNRWRDANLVRWRDGSMRPIGGWISRDEAVIPDPPRAMISWVDNSADSRLALGSACDLYVVNALGTVTDITPVGLTCGTVDAAENKAYGGGFYGTGYYGVARPSTGVFQEATTWALDTWGEYLVACSSADGDLYEWQLNVANPAATISNAPTNCKSLVVTEERFLFALAAGGNPRKVQWCDREDNTTWTPAATNEAGDFELQTTGQLMCGLRMRGRTLLLTDTDAHIATYSGPPFVYGFERVGTACGVASRKAAIAIDEGAFWMGQNGFYAFDGSVAREIACDVNDFVFDNINRDQISKAYAVHNSQFGEIWWFYPSSESIENNRYVILDYKERHWSIGEIERTAGVDRGVFDTPIWSDASSDLYNHESGYVHTGTVFAETGPISLGNGDQVMKVNNLIPDEKTQGEVEVTFLTRFHPNDTQRSYGPYSTANPTSVRFTGRQIRMRVEGTGNDNWRSGIMRIEALPGGRR